jgi:hypothetical protein
VDITKDVIQGLNEAYKLDKTIAPVDSTSVKKK